MAPMETFEAVLVVLSLLMIPLCLWEARRDRRPLKVYDDVVSHLLMPMALLPFLLKLPPLAIKVVLAIPISIFVGRTAQLIRQSLETRRKRVDAAPDGRSGTPG
jgi:hypothetical protein